MNEHLGKNEKQLPFKKRRCCEKSSDAPHFKRRFIDVNNNKSNDTVEQREEKLVKSLEAKIVERLPRQLNLFDRGNYNSEDLTLLALEEKELRLPLIKQENLEMLKDFEVEKLIRSLCEKFEFSLMTWQCTISCLLRFTELEPSLGKFGVLKVACRTLIFFVKINEADETIPTNVMVVEHVRQQEPSFPWEFVNLFDGLILLDSKSLVTPAEFLSCYLSVAAAVDFDPRPRTEPRPRTRASVAAAQSGTSTRLWRAVRSVGEDNSKAKDDFLRMRVEALNLMNRVASDWARYPPSSVAAAAVFAARVQVRLPLSWPAALRTLTGYSFQDVGVLAAALAFLS
ncbi:uncharacterized protein LOC108673156 isoform X2 [Hyalella azteca]|nr:uncharacterized protein LOC108673156 isoform X2 [Hyalella azteca]